MRVLRRRANIPPFGLACALAALGFLAILIMPTSARADDPATAFFARSPRYFKICENQTYALCAVAGCFVFDGLSYCKCDVKSGDSISIPYDYGRHRDVCTANAEGEKNGYMISTFSIAPSVVAPYGNQALYDCPARTSNGAYAQCDGGVCFTSSEGQSFPWLRQAAQQKRDHLLVPDHGRKPDGDDRLSDRRSLPLPAILFPELPKSRHQQRNRNPDLCRRPDRRRPRPDPRALRPCPAAQRVPPRISSLGRGIARGPVGSAAISARAARTPRAAPRGGVAAASGRSRQGRDRSPGSYTGSAIARP